MANLSVYSASAGSGKTFTIAYEYISMMLNAVAVTRGSYRNILAVTFTNKACDEMKSRIVLNLFLISNIDKLPADLKQQVKNIISKINEKTSLPENDIVKYSKIFFTQIIHDYSFFSVFTIDKFFQRIVRNLTYELDMQQNYELELKTELVIAQLVDDLMLMAETDKDLSENISKLIEDNIENGNKWSPKESIKKFIKQAIDSDFTGLDCDIDGYEKQIDGIINDYTEAFVSNIEKIIALANSRKLSIDDFKKTGKFPRCLKFAGIKPGIQAAHTIIKEYKGAEWFSKSDWFNKNSPNADMVDQLDSYANAITDLDFELFSTAYVVKKNMNLLRLLGKATDILHENLNRDSIFLLSDVPSLLSSIIKESSDANGDLSIMPFVFESVGTRYNNFMIDEFQDTSDKQWDIFRVMLQESLANGNDSIVVGDIKQSIYSWRGGDWTILSNLVNRKLLDDYVDTRHLDKNYRTAKNIVEFNNDFFSTEYKNNLGKFGNPESADKTFATLYDDVQQGVTKNKDSEIKISLYNGSYGANDEAPRLRIFRDMVSEIENLQLNYNVQPKDITILVRKNGEAAYIANSFLSITEKKDGVRYDVVSDETLYLVSSRAVRIILAYMRYVLNNKDIISLVEASYLYYLEKNGNASDFDVEAMKESFLADLNAEDGLNEKQSFEIVEIMINRLKLNEKETNVPFLIAFRNVVHNFSERSTDLRAFMEYWDERGVEETLKIPESQNAIRIITIHKAKGLEANYVFIPFCNWKFIGGGMGTEYLFVKNTIGDGDFKIPVASNKILENTRMRGDYENNRYRQAVEAYNMLYVAFTRAKYGLYVSAYCKNGDTRAADKVSYMLTDYFSDERFDEDIVDPKTNAPIARRGDGWSLTTEDIDSMEVRRFVKGQLESNEEAGQIASNFITEYPVSEKPVVNIAHHIHDDIDGDRKAMIRGTKYHSVFERIITKDDVVPSVALMFDNGEIDRETYRSLVSELGSSLSAQQVARWYDGSCQVYNEFNIIDPNSDDKLKRPDRVMVYPDEVVVLDYKFGQEENLKKYTDQVRDYARLLSEMKQFEGKKISSYIWYYFRNEIVKVDSSGQTEITNLNN